MIVESTYQAERRLVSMVLAWPRAIHAVTDVLEASQISDNALRTLFVAAVESYGDTGSHDVVDILRRAKSDEVSAAFIGQLIREAESTDQFAEQRAQEVVDHAVRRQLSLVAEQMAKELAEPHCDPELVQRRCTERLNAIAKPERQGLRHAHEIVSEAMIAIDRRMSGERDDRGIGTGIWSLDRMTGGMRPGELIVLAARPGMGKTALALNIAEIVAVIRRLPTLFVSLEMSDDELMQRLFASISGVRAARIRKAILSDEELSLVTWAGQEVIKDAPLVVDARASLTIGKIASAARRLAARPQGLRFIVIDYIQLIEPTNRREPRHEQVSAISRELKQLAKSLGVPILCLAQLNRQVESRNDRRPRKSDLRESGSIEQDADVVLLVHREAEYLTGQDREALDKSATLIVDKNRHGPTGDVFLRWLPSTMQFAEVACHGA